MISNEVRAKKFIELVYKGFEQKKDNANFVLTIADIQQLCFSSEYLPRNQADIYLFISFLLKEKVLDRARNGVYIFDFEIAGAFL
jgi:hypothetical protein